jgi:glycosyltransferase involved in cell wall biosynthesis
MSNTHSVAIAHKDYDVRGGGEVLAEELARTFDAPLVVGHRNDECEPDSHALDIHEIPLKRWQEWAINHGGAPRSLAYQLAWQAVPKLTEYDTIITSGNEPLWYVPEDDQTLVAYTHSTPRFQYDLFQSHYQQGSLLGGLYATAVRTLYQTNVTKPDLFVANSDRVARRINQYWNIPDDQIRVVYPPVPTSEYSPQAAETQDYYLYLGRLAGHKRVDEVLNAFNQLNVAGDYHLKIAGTGPQEGALREQADGNIEFLGYVDEDEKHELYAGARALVYPSENEDFGMVPIEAMSAGTPVLGVQEGFTEYQIKDGRNGWTWARQGGHLRETIRYFESNGVDWYPGKIAGFARQHFGIEAFREGMRAAVADARKRARVTTPWMDSEDDRSIDPGERADVEAAPDGGASQ